MPGRRDSNPGFAIRSQRNKILPFHSPQEPSMASPTRDEFLSHVHARLVNPSGDPAPGSPTKSTMRYRWRELLQWDVETEAEAYWDGLADNDKNARLAVRPTYWEVVQDQLDSFTQPFSSEPTLRVPFSTALQIPHNIAIRDASDVHAEMWTEGSRLDTPPIGNADFIMVYDGKLTGLIELKTWWKVTEAEIEQVRTGPSRIVQLILMTGREPLDGVHHGRLAIEQTYGYLVFDKVVYGIMATFNAFVFLKRQSPGVLHMSRTIPITSTTPTILKLLYFFSYLCALDSNPHPEVNSEGDAINLRSAPKTTDKAPKIPDPNYIRPQRTVLPSATFENNPRRSPRFLDSSPTETLHLANLTSLGCKGWRGTLNNGQVIFAKLWDGWKFSASYSENEASVYYRLRDLWGTMVPDFLGIGNWGFCHILLLSNIDVSS